MGQENPTLKLAPLAKRLYVPNIDARTDPRGREYVWICGPPCGYEGEGTSDVPLFEEGYATLTPLSLNSTSHTDFGDLEIQFDSLL